MHAQLLGQFGFRQAAFGAVSEQAGASSDDLLAVESSGRLVE